MSEATEESDDKPAICATCPAFEAKLKAGGVWQGECRADAPGNHFVGLEDEASDSRSVKVSRVPVFSSAHPQVPETHWCMRHPDRADLFVSADVQLERENAYRRREKQEAFFDELAPVVREQLEKLRNPPRGIDGITGASLASDVITTREGVIIAGADAAAILERSGWDREKGFKRAPSLAEARKFGTDNQASLEERGVLVPGKADTLAEAERQRLEATAQQEGRKTG